MVTTDLLSVAETLRRAYLDEFEAHVAHSRDALGIPLGIDVETLESTHAILKAAPEVQVAFVRVTFEWMLASDPGPGVSLWMSRWQEMWRLSEVTQRLLRRALPYREEDVEAILNLLAFGPIGWGVSHPTPGFTLSAPFHSIERWRNDHMLSCRALEAVQVLRKRLDGVRTNAEGRALLKLLDAWLGRASDDTLALDPQDAWGQAALESLAAMDAQARSAWLDVLAFAATAKGPRPSRTWQTRARQVLDTYGHERFAATASEWLRLMERRGSASGDSAVVATPVLSDLNGDVLKGLAWCCGLVEDPTVVRALGAAAEACFRKVPNIGARSVKAGNACLWAIGAQPGITRVVELQRLEQRVKYATARFQIGETLRAAAAANGLTPEDLADIAVPDFGMVEGVLAEPVGAVTAEIALDARGELQLRWRRADGRVQASVPTEVKREHPDAVKQLRRTVKDIETAMIAQRMRIERLLLSYREWDYAAWRERFRDHALLRVLTRRLIWTFEADGLRSEGLWVDGQMLGPDGASLEWLSDETRVRLWHPITASVEQVLAYREWLERYGVTQPFKQAHREIYLLTDAERATATYSNRFAAHVLRQHQFAALCRERGWRYTLQGGWDGFNAPAIDLPGWDLSASFFVDGGLSNDAPLTHQGIYVYVATDQVRFSRRDDPMPLPLEEVPAVVFSEIMRDVDLFVGVCSVGSDPNWLDGGPEVRMQQYDGYWWEQAFGDLSASAQTRRQVLERLLPRLAIGERCTLESRYLRVQGQIRSYRIHLGSGNILMEPNDQYLCIVPGRGSANPLESGGVFLPFEGDRTLSVILSKALMLANDREIRDPTITRQIRA
jgi:hypothetical protein